MAQFVLVHGAWHGAWCWYKVVPALERLGHAVQAIDLPSHGVDRTPLANVTLEAYAERVGEAISQASEPVVLVGHSLGGIVISAAGERYSDGIARLVYLAAFLTGGGAGAIQLAGADSLVPAAIVPDPDGLALRVRDDALREVFYGDCSAEDVALARACLVPQRADILESRLALTDARWGRLPRDYIVCSADRAITKAAQQRMIDTVGCARVVTMDTSHSPFFSAPQALATHLSDLSR